MSGAAGIPTAFFGSGAFAVPVLEALASMPDISLVAVVSAPDRPVGRKAVLTPTPVAARARELGLRLLQPARVRTSESVAVLEALAPELCVLADYGQLIPKALLELPERGFLNLHPSPLPRWRGAAPIPAAILAGDSETAVTLMILVEQMDAGPIVAMEPLAIRDDDTAETLEARAAGVAAVLLRRALPQWLAGKLPPHAQPSGGVTLTRPLRREDALLDPQRSACELERQVRAFQPWPGSYLDTDTGRLIVCRAHVADAEAGDVPGRLVAVGRDGLALCTREGRLVLDEVQPAGSRRMSAAELLRGRPALVR